MSQLIGRIVDGAGRIGGIGNNQIIHMAELGGRPAVEKPTHGLFSLHRKQKVGDLWKDSPDEKGRARWHGTLLGHGITATDLGQGVIGIYGEDDPMANVEKASSLRS